VFVVSNLVLAVARVAELAIWAYFWIIIARAVVSWVSPDPYNPLVRFLHRVTEPVLRPIRYRLPAAGGLDFSPMIVLVALYFIEIFLVGSLRDLAVSLR
jgi:YggT family protein